MQGATPYPTRSGLDEKPQGFERAMGLVAGGGNRVVIGDRSQYDGSTGRGYTHYVKFQKTLTYL